MAEMISHFQSDVRRINHALKVLDFAYILSKEIITDRKTRETIYFTAILHDIGIKEAERKYNSTAGNYQEIEGPPIAHRILTNLCIDEKIIDRVCFIIGNHHSYSKIDDMDFQIIVEADFLVNIFEDDMNKAAISNIYNNIFKTESGKRLFGTMYLSK